MSALAVVETQTELRSPFVDELIRARALTCWCTPATTVRQHCSDDVLGSDISCSYGRMGSLADLSGVFGEVAAYVAESYGAARTLPSVNGTTGSNHVIARAIALLGPKTTVLLNRGAHHSAYRGLVEAGVEFDFIHQEFDSQFEAFKPVTTVAVSEALARHPNADAVWISSPVYEGGTADLKAIVDMVHGSPKGASVFVDEAWGAHFAFHPDLAPLSALRAGADVVAQSTHKTAGALQQAAVLHIGVSANPVVADAVVSAWREATTTSPSYHLIGSIDAAVRLMRARGHEYIDTAAARALLLADTVKAAKPRLTVMNPGGDPGCDPLKVTFALHDYGPTGHAVAQALEKAGVVAEKAGVRTLTMLATYDLDVEAVRRTAEAIIEVLGEPIREPHPVAPTPFERDVVYPDLPPAEAVRLSRRIGRRVPLTDAVGAIALEEAEAYPPGVPILLPGYRVTAEAVEYLLETKSAGGRIVASDPTLTTLLVTG